MGSEETMDALSAVQKFAVDLYAERSKMRHADMANKTKDKTILRSSPRPDMLTEPLPLQHDVEKISLPSNVKNDNVEAETERWCVDPINHDKSRVIPDSDPGVDADTENESTNSEHNTGKIQGHPAQADARVYRPGEEISYKTSPSISRSKPSSSPKPQSGKKRRSDVPTFLFSDDGTRRGYKKIRRHSQDVSPSISATYPLSDGFSGDEVYETGDIYVGRQHKGPQTPAAVRPLDLTLSTPTDRMRSSASGQRSLSESVKRTRRTDRVSQHRHQIETRSSSLAAPIRISSPSNHVLGEKSRRHVHFHRGKEIMVHDNLHGDQEILPLYSAQSESNKVMQSCDHNKLVPGVVKTPTEDGRIDSSLGQESTWKTYEVSQSQPVLATGRVRQPSQDRSSMICPDTPTSEAATI